MSEPVGHVAFMPTVKEIQERRGSRASYAKLEAPGPSRATVTPDLIAFLEQVDTAYVATASANGRPYAQHRGGPKGFIRALDERTLGFVDFVGNRQYITLGNLAENDRAFLFLMDYANRRRVKVWGRARVVEDDTALLSRLMPEGYKARPEQAFLFTVEAWDVNCSQHIPQKLDAEEVTEIVQVLRQRVHALEAENAELHRQIDEREGAAFK